MSAVVLQETQTLNPVHFRFPVCFFLYLSVSVCLSVWCPIIILFAIFMWAFDQLANRYRLSVDESTLIYAKLTVENLDDYFASKNSQFPERGAECRIEASKNARKMLSVIEKKWIVGSFELGKETLGATLSKFKKSLRNRLIPNIEESKDETVLKDARETVNDFVGFLSLDPSVEHLENFTNSINDDFKEITVLKKSRSDDFSAYLVRYKIIKHSLLVSGITGLAFFV